MDDLDIHQKHIQNLPSKVYTFKQKIQYFSMIMSLIRQVKKKIENWLTVITFYMDLAAVGSYALTSATEYFGSGASFTPSTKLINTVHVHLFSLPLLHIFQLQQIQIH